MSAQLAGIVIALFGGEDAAARALAAIVTQDGYAPGLPDGERTARLAQIDREIAALARTEERECLRLEAEHVDAIVMRRTSDLDVPAILQVWRETLGPTGWQRKLRRLWDLSDEFSRSASVIGDTRQARIAEREHARRAVKDLEHELAGNVQGRVVIHQRSDAEFARGQDRQMHEALAHHRQRLETIEIELRELAEREARARPIRQAIGNFADAIMRAVGPAGEQLRRELGGVQ